MNNMTKGIKGNHGKVDITKSSNIKCEHCEHWEKNEMKCKLIGKERMYYQRCKSFEWCEKYLHQDGQSKKFSESYRK